MFSKKLKKLGLITGIAASIALVGCSSDNDGDNEDKSFSQSVDYTITGIEPGAGISVTTEKAIEEYDQLQGWEVDLSSTAAMMAELETAIEKKEPIIITGWNPHWMFAKYPDMKYLDDPKGVYGDVENINSLARLGFEEDNPEAFKFIDQFEWTPEDMEEIMYESQDTGDSIEKIAEQWVEDNADRVAKWSEGVEDGNGTKVDLVSTPWDSERASSSVLKIAMEQKGFEVNITEVDVAIVFESLANGDADATLAAWLPITHEKFLEDNKDKLVDLGPNLTGAKMGLVVPDYVDLESIEDLEAK